MTITIPKSVCKIVGVVFTAFFAPLGVKLAENHWSAPPASPITLPAEPPAATSSTATRIVAKGTGPTAEAAFQNALDNALQVSITNEVTATDWNQRGAYYLATLRRNGNGVLTGWQELSNVAERNLLGRTFRSEVAVEVNPTILRERLRVAQPARSLLAHDQPVGEHCAAEVVRFQK